jgi:hypothetical protein
METRVTNLEVRLTNLEHQVQRFNDAMLGTTDGKPGILELIRSSLEASRNNGAKLDALTLKLAEHSLTLDSIRLDRAKLIGVMFTISALWTILVFVLKYVI